MTKEQQFDLEERLIGFSVRCIKVAESLPNTRAGLHLGDQLTRSGTSPSLNYGEAQGAESRKDFIHKMKICLKELRETSTCLRIIIRAEMLSVKKLQPLLDESVELISIFVTSVKTAKQNMGETS